MSTLIERYAKRIRGVLSCHDRVVISGTLPEICHAHAMTWILVARDTRIFDYTPWAQPLRKEIRESAEKLARESGLEIEFIRKKNFRQEDRIRTLVAKRGEHPGLVHIFSTMEPCSSFQPWHDKSTHKIFLKPTPPLPASLFRATRSSTPRLVLCSTANSKERSSSRSRCTSRSSPDAPSGPIVGRGGRRAHQFPECGGSSHSRIWSTVLRVTEW